MILVDTSVWIDHLRRGNERLHSLLLEDGVLCHPFIVGEMACGSLKNRKEILGLLALLPQAQVAEHEEVLQFLESRQLYGFGLGWIVAHLLASVVLTDCDFWTLDKTFHRVAEKLKISF